MTPRIQLGCILTGVLLGAVLFHWAGSQFQDFDPQQAGLGLDTVAQEDSRISTTVNPLELVPTMRTARAAGNHVVLWLGASQLHAINDPRPGDVLAVEHVNVLGRNTGAKLAWVQCTLPNANFHELLCGYLVLRGVGAKADTLLIALTYDDLREEGLRSEVRQWMHAPAAWPPESVSVELASLAKELKAPPTNGDAPVTLLAENPVSGSPQEKLEAVLVGGIESIWPAYRHRGTIHSQLRAGLWSGVVRIMYGSFQRRYPEMPAHLRNWNHGALVHLIELARADGLRVCLYKQPHRQKMKPFLHNRQKFDRWHSAVEAFAAERPGVYYRDFEALVPRHLWGLTQEGFPDAFHFQGEGHRRLGTAIHAWLSQLPQD